MRACTNAYQQALDLYREFSDRYFYAVVLAHMAETHSAVHQPQDAREALSIMEELEHPGAAGVRERLGQLKNESDGSGSKS